ncbi:MAG: ribosome silencing factor [Desulfosudis oleivorans]|nr:ribosome silencing factor [Desulfosudis oleivorans]
MERYIAEHRLYRIEPERGAGSAITGLLPGERVFFQQSERSTRILESKEKALWCAQLALDKKAADLVLLDVQQQSSFTSYFIICSGTSDRRVQAIAAHLEASCKQAGMRPLGIEGVREGRWVLLDYADVVIHIFHEPVREFYDLERLWTDAQRIAVETVPEIQKQNQDPERFRDAGKSKAQTAKSKKGGKDKISGTGLNSHRAVDAGNLDLFSSWKIGFGVLS